MVSSLLQISDSGGGSDVFFDGLDRRLVVLFLIAFGLGLLGVPMVGMFGSVANDGFGFQEAAHGHPIDGLPGCGTGLLPPLVGSNARILSLQWPAWRWLMGVHHCGCVFGGPGRWLLRYIPSFGAFHCCSGLMDGADVLVKKQCAVDRLKKARDLVVFFISFMVLYVI
jgi:hypothetical protein